MYIHIILALAIHPVNPDTADGWKINIDYENHCENETEESFFECIDRISYIGEEVILNHNSSQFNITDLYTENWDGISQLLIVGKNVIRTNYDYSMEDIRFDSNISYFIYIMDERLQFVTANPNIIPRSKLTIKENAGQIFLFFKAIRHEKLNKPDRPCEPSVDHNFAQCLEKSVVDKIGCQPPWRRFIVMEQPVCDNWTLLLRYGDEISNLYNMDRIDLYEATNCLMPCTFMEYKECAL